MNSLFGLPMDTLMRVLLGAFLIITVVVAILALRNRLFFKLGLRNLPRRRAQTTLIIFGLMLSTVIFTSAFGAGDSLSHSVRVQATSSLGAIDETVTAATINSRSGRGPGGSVSHGAGYFSAGLAGRIRAGLAPGLAAGVVGIAQETVPLTDLTSRQTKDAAGLLGAPTGYPAAFGPLTTTSGDSVTLAQLGAGQVYLSKPMADKLNAHAGDRLRIYVANAPVYLIVRAILRSAYLGGYTDLLLPLDRMQTLLGRPGQVNQVLISNTGDLLNGAGASDRVTGRTRALLSNDLAITGVKALLTAPAGHAALSQRIKDLTAQGGSASLVSNLTDLQRQAALPGISNTLRQLLDDSDVIDTLGALGNTTLSNQLTSAIHRISAYTVHTDKQDALSAADTIGSIFTTIFITFGLFSISAGVALIFLIFVMLAAERRAEMGMARAVGTKRRHLIQQFLFEGYSYDLGAALVGVVIGVGVNLALTAVISALVSQFGISVQWYVEPRSLVITFCLGALVTFLTVAASAGRVSRLNIVTAIRDLPDDLRLSGSVGAAFRRPVADLRRAGQRIRRGRVLGALLALLAAPWHLITAFRVFISRGPLLLVLCPLLINMGISGKQLWPFNIGISLGLIGGAMLLRWILGGLGVRDRIRNRIGFSLAGILLVVFWLLPFDALRSDLSFDIEMFFISGLFLILGGVWTVMYNIDLIVAGALRATGGLSRLTPIVRMAVSYPLQQRFRTGMTMFMFSLVLFSLVVQLVVSSSFDSEALNLNQSVGGYDAWGTTGAANPIQHLGARVAGNPDLRRRVAAVGQLSPMTVDIYQSTAKGQNWNTGYGVGVLDDAYLAGTRFPFQVRAAGYGSDAQVWSALRAHPGLAVISGDMVADKPGDGETISGVTYADHTFAPFQISLRDQSGQVILVTVIGVLNNRNAFGLGLDFSLYTSRRTLTAAHMPLPTNPVYLFRAAPGQNVHAMGLALGSAFLNNGLDMTEAQHLYDTERATQTGFENMLAAFMALGLVVGIAALGVVAFRSVVERRQQIGMLRALGFQRGMIRASFLLESSFITLLGTLTGVALGLVLSWNLVAYFAKTEPQLTLTIPWVELGLIALGAYLASLLTTYLPARQASRVFPAEALRYE
ncbi:MAG TPA: FtsX-like permease family protein [Chloroflexota bacterium]|nr:FtsX-like permease family protein [Chloroflexota bacterium]